MTLVEIMVAMVILLIGVLATFVMLDVANSDEGQASAREGATNLARELLESAHDKQFQQIGSSGWFTPTLQSVQGGSGTVTTVGTFTQQTSVKRRNVTYTVSATACSVDDSRDGFGTHAATTNWCSDSTSTGSADAQPEDLKRVAIHVTWSVGGRSQQLDQTATFGASGAIVGPAITNLTISTPVQYSGQANPVVTSNPSDGNIVFTATSAGASDMKFTVNGVEQVTGVANAGNGSWTLTWPISSLPDATYTIAATAIDALGTRGQPRTLPVKLNRGAPSALQNLVGGYNYVWTSSSPPPGSKALVVELAWDANPEGSVTGYEVDRGGSVVCGGSTSLATSCIDLSPASTGTSTYTVKTWYRDPSGNLQSISTSYNVSAPGAGSVATNWSITAGISSNGVLINGISCNTDLVGNYSGGIGGSATAAQAQFCSAQFSAPVTLAAGSATATMWFTNTGTKACSETGQLEPSPSGNLGNITGPTIPAGTSSPTKFTVNFTVTAHTFAAGDRLGWLQNVTGPTNCGKVVMYIGTAANNSMVSLPTLTSSGSALAQPTAPTNLTLTNNGDGTTTLNWTAPTGTPGPDFYRIYRDGQLYTSRYDTIGDTGASTVTWIDTANGGTSHTYYVTTVASTLAESSSMAGPVSG